MGCMESSPGFDMLMKSPEFRHTMAQFKSMQLSENDVKRLYRVFELVDQDHSNSIALIELMDHIDLPRTVYTEKIFSIFDKDKSGAIDFREFVFSVWNYCTLTKINLDQFAFDLYDTDGSGSLSPGEVLKMIQDIFGKNEMKTNVHAKAISTELQQFEDKKQNFDAEKFHKFMLYHQAMLFPAFQMQQALQRKILGTFFWERQSERRLHDSNGEYVSISRYAMKTQQELSNNDEEPRHRNKRKNGSATSSLSSQPSTLSSNSRGSGLRASFGSSAKEKWNAGVQGVANLYISISGKHKKAKQTNKVHPGGVLPPTDTSFGPPSPHKHHSPSHQSHHSPSHHSHSHSTHSGHSGHSRHSPRNHSHHGHHGHHASEDVVIDIRGVGSPVVSPRHSNGHHGHQGHRKQDHDELSTHSGYSSHSHAHSHSSSHHTSHSPHHGQGQGQGHHHHNDPVVKHYSLVEPFTEIDEVDPVSGAARSRANTGHVSATDAAMIAEHLKKRRHTGI